MVLLSQYIRAAAITGRARCAVGHAPSRLEPGAPADLVAIPAATVREAIATQPAGRLTFRAGTLVCGTPPATSGALRQVAPAAVP